MSMIVDKQLRCKKAHVNINSLFFTANIVDWNRFHCSFLCVMSLINITQNIL